MYKITVSHNFETAHRTPKLPGKCQSLHGHSWWAHITLACPELKSDGTIIEFGILKKEVRRWIDDHLDHGTMLDPDDPLFDILNDDGHCKVTSVPGGPTVENVAMMIARVTADILMHLDASPHVFVSDVRVRETHVNEASWTKN